MGGTGSPRVRTAVARECEGHGAHSERLRQGAAAAASEDQEADSDCLRGRRHDDTAEGGVPAEGRDRDLEVGDTGYDRAGPEVRLQDVPQAPEVQRAPAHAAAEELPCQSPVDGGGAAGDGERTEGDGAEKGRPEARDYLEAIATRSCSFFFLTEWLLASPAAAWIISSARTSSTARGELKAASLTPSEMNLRARSTLRTGDMSTDWW